MGTSLVMKIEYRFEALNTVLTKCSESLQLQLQILCTESTTQEGFDPEKKQVKQVLLVAVNGEC